MVFVNFTIVPVIIQERSLMGYVTLAVSLALIGLAFQMVCVILVVLLALTKMSIAIAPVKHAILLSIRGMLHFVLVAV